MRSASARRSASTSGSRAAAGQVERLPVVRIDAGTAASISSSSDVDAERRPASSAQLGVVGADVAAGELVVVRAARSSVGRRRTSGSLRRSWSGCRFPRCHRHLRASPPAGRAFPVGEAASRLLSSVASPDRSVGLRDSGEVAPSAPRAHLARPWALPTGVVSDARLPRRPASTDAGRALTIGTMFADHIGRCRPSAAEPLPDRTGRTRLRAAGRRRRRPARQLKALGRPHPDGHPGPGPGAGGTVTELAAAPWASRRARVAHHVEVLRRAGLLRVVRDPQGPGHDRGFYGRTGAPSTSPSPGPEHPMGAMLAIALAEQIPHGARERRRLHHPPRPHPGRAGRRVRRAPARGGAVSSPAARVRATSSTASSPALPDGPRRSCRAGGAAERASAGERMARAAESGIDERGAGPARVALLEAVLGQPDVERGRRHGPDRLPVAGLGRHPQPAPDRPGQRGQPAAVAGLQPARGRHHRPGGPAQDHRDAATRCGPA